MTMEAAGAPTKPGLFSTLAAHEVAQPIGDDRRGPTHGLRPRLPNRFETLDLNRRNQPLEEQVETLTPPQSGQPGNKESGLDATGSQPSASAPVIENPSQPSNRLQSGLRSQSDEPVFSLNVRPADDPTPNDRPLASRIFGTPGLDKPSPGSIESSRPETVPTQPLRAHDLLPEKTITERLNTFERETIHEIRPVGLFAQTSDHNAGVTPRLLPTQGLIPQAEKYPDPTIEIHIGRIEVRAQVQATPPKPEKTPAPATDNSSLQAYLRSRSRGARS